MGWGRVWRGGFGHWRGLRCRFERGRDSGLPHAEQNADPLEDEGAAGGVASGVRSEFGFVHSFGCRILTLGALTAGVVVAFMEGLSEKRDLCSWRAGPAGLDRWRLPSLLGDGGEAGVVSQFLVRLGAFAVRAEGDNQSGDATSRNSATFTLTAPNCDLMCGGFGCQSSFGDAKISQGRECLKGSIRSPPLRRLC